MHPALARLLERVPVVTDGAWGTEMQKRGLSVGTYPDAWNLTNPGLVEDVARSYVAAGSEVILTNTFGANRIALGRQGLADQVVDINRSGARISKRAAGGKALVFGSIGPTGAMLLMGEVTEEDMLSAFREQAQGLAEGGADGIVIETMADLAEAKIALQSARETLLPVVVSMTFDTGPAKDRTMMGVTPEQAARELSLAGADVVGANCGQGIEGYPAIACRLCDAADKPVWLKPNAGLPELVEGKAVYRTSAEMFAESIPELLEAGVAFLGGCCGTNPDFVRAIRRAAENRRASHPSS
jgi:5-methyltetrahydrofolate--homocysteine methyltransferase